VNVTLVFFKSSGTRKDIPLRAGRYVIGRTPEADLRLPLPSVSRRHCEIVVDDDGPRARDLGSSNGTYLNDLRLTSETELGPGDTIGVGPCRFTIQINGQPATIKPPATPGPDLSETPSAPIRAVKPGPDEDDGTDLDETVARTSGIGGPKGAGIEDSSVFDFDFDFEDDDAPKL
jgi:predicted component of type VI protein secretion system